MVARIVAESLRRRPRAKLAVVASVALGAGAAGGLVMLFLHVGDLLGEELRRFDANIEIFDPAGEIELSRLEALRGEECRWRHQIRRITPELRAEVDGIVLLGRDPDPAWRVQGRPGVLAGVSLGLGPGDRIAVGGRSLEVTGTVATGGGNFKGPALVQLYCATQGASMGYTTQTDGKPHWHLYTGPIRLEPGTTTHLRFKAIRIGYRESQETGATFTVS